MACSHFSGLELPGHEYFRALIERNQRDLQLWEEKKHGVLAVLCAACGKR